MPPKTIKASRATVAPPAVKPIVVEQVPENSKPEPEPEPLATTGPFRGLQLSHLPPPSVAAQVETWLAQMTEQEFRLQQLAAAFLKTSYFPEKTHGFKKWLSQQPQAAQNPASSKSK